MINLRIPLLTLAFLFSVCPFAFAKHEISIQTNHRGINLIAVAPPPSPLNGITLMAARPAINTLRSAIDHIYDNSHFIAGVLADLKKAGNVTIIYDAEFPKEPSSTTIAAFLPDFYQPSGSLKEFIVVVSRFGVKWPTGKLAAVLVHELAGHGYQTLRRGGTYKRKIDRECEARLYQEAAYQDFKLNRMSRDLVRFRTSNQRHWCSDFRRYIIKHDPESMNLWNFGTPNIHGLLKVFARYTQHLRDTGVSARAGLAEHADRLKVFKNLKKLALYKNDSQLLLTVAESYLNGIGTIKDVEKAKYWFAKSARAGNSRAALVLHQLKTTGSVVMDNRIQSYKWYELASRSHPRNTVRQHTTK